MAERFLVGETAAPQGVFVPASVSTKITRNAALLKQKTAAIAEQKKANKVKRSALKLRASKYAKQYRDEEAKLVAMRRQAKATGNFFVEPEKKLLLVMRISGINKMEPKARKILQLLRLDQLHKATFVKVTKPTVNMLKCVQPFVVMGYPTKKTVQNLILKRGHARVDESGISKQKMGPVAKISKYERKNFSRLPITSNEMISASLGKFGIHGVDDLVHEIYTVGPNFKQANSFLWAFKLSSPNGGWVQKKHGYQEPKGGDWGNREELVNELVARMM
jgi:large subunit ribosomal protein L7e